MSQALTDDRLAQLRALVNDDWKEWYFEEGVIGGLDCHTINESNPGESDGWLGSFGFAMADEARLCVEAHNALPWLLGEVERLRDENARLRALLKPFADYALALDRHGQADGVPVGVYTHESPTAGHCRAALRGLSGEDGR